MLSRTTVTGSVRGAAAVLLALSVGLAAPRARSEEGPEWWRNRGVIDLGQAPNDYAALNMGQLKNLAYMAWLEMGGLPGGAGFTLTFSGVNDNYAAVTVGQLKALARPFYDRMGLTNCYPWADGPATNDYAIANIGQAKYVFSFDPLHPDFDGDGMPDAWEAANGFNPYDPSDAAGDADSDGLSNLNEFLLGTPPRSGSVQAPGATAASAPALGPGQSGLLVLTPSAFAN